MDEVAVLYASLRVSGSGVMVDVGAHHGRSLATFAESGWQVFAFEPDPTNRAVLQSRLGHRSNVTVDGRAISTKDGQSVELYTSDVSSGISSLVPFHPSHRPSTLVETVRLDTYLAEVDQVTVLKVDAEGHDLPILKTFPWARLHPRGVVCEFEDRRTADQGYNHRDMADFLVGHGYAVLVSEWFPVTEYGARHRWREIRLYPTRLADSSGWGNLIAVTPADAEIVMHEARKFASWPSRWRRSLTRVRT